MSKRMLKHPTGEVKEKNKGVGKVYGRTRGPLVWSEELNRKTTSKMIEAIESNKK